jgi:hypothetical protein
MFVCGIEACAGQLCQKQPSQNTQTRARVKTMSGRTFRSGVSTE